MEDLRKLMLPYTALQFQEDPKNRKLTLAKYCQDLALPMGITHILAFSQSEQRLNMRLARTPEGPTLTFRVTQFSLAKHIKALQRRPVSDQARSLHQNPPIVVTNNFGDASAPPQIKLLRITFQNMFPAINVATVKLTECRRVVLFHLIDEEVEEEINDDGDDDNEDETNKEDKNDDGADQESPKPKKLDKTKRKKKTRKVVKQRVQIRHYAIKAAPVGIDRKVRRLVQSKLPNLNRVQDIADYITGQAATGGGGSVGDVSDSEAEDDPAHVVQLAQSYAGKGNIKQQKSALKLVEMGPRLSLELIKVEKGLGGGDVMYHAHVHKTPQEAKELKMRKEGERNLKKQRREEQDRNVERKRKATEEKREAKRKRKEEREQEAMEALRQGGGAVGAVRDLHNEDEESGSGEEESGNDSGEEQSGDDSGEESE